MDFEDKVILITGAGSGIGAGAAMHLAKLGGKIVLVDINEKNVKEVAEQIKKENVSSEPMTIVADVTIDAKRIIDEAIAHFKQLNVLVNNAGIVLYDNVNSVQMAEFDRIFDVNIRSVVTLTHLAIPHLEKSKGNIVNVASISALQAEPNLMSYSMSKVAINQFTKCIALDLAPKGIRANAINPSAIRTPIFESAGLSPEKIEQILDAIRKSYPVGRVGNVGDTSRAIAFLANDANSFLTGISLPVDGGALLASCDLQSMKE